MQFYPHLNQPGKSLLRLFIITLIIKLRGLVQIKESILSGPYTITENQ